MSDTQNRSDWVRRGLVALGVTVTVMGAAGLAGFTFSILEKMPEGAERSLYTFGATAVAVAVTLLGIYGGSRLFLRGEQDGDAAGSAGTAKPIAEADGGKAPASGGLANFGYIVILVAVFRAYMDFMDRGGEYMKNLLSLDHPPVALMFALAVTPIMGILAVGERPQSAAVKWRTVVFTAALWPAALLADTMAPVTFSGIIAVICWIALGGAIGTLDVMFSLSAPRKFEEKLQGVLPLAIGWSPWHGVAFLAVYFGLRRLDGATTIPFFEGNPAFFAALFAAATIALSRPRGARRWMLACHAGAAVAALLLGGTAIAGRVADLAGTDKPFLHLAAHLMLALPAIAAAVISVMRLSPREDGSGEGAG